MVYSPWQAEVFRLWVKISQTPPPFLSFRFRAQSQLTRLTKSIYSLALKSLGFHTLVFLLLTSLQRGLTALAEVFSQMLRSALVGLPLAGSASQIRLPSRLLAVVPRAAASTTGGRTRNEPPSPLELATMSLPAKLTFAWSLFFPVKETDHARNDAKKRLRMILVADRCALSPQSLTEMKAAIVRVVSTYVVVDQGEEVDVSMTNDAELGACELVFLKQKELTLSCRHGLQRRDPGEAGEACCACAVLR